MLAASGSARVQPLAELKLRLRSHMEAEEAEFYPQVAALGTDEATAITTALTQHDTIEAAIVDLESSISTGKINTLKTALNDHITFERKNYRTSFGLDLTDRKSA